MKIKQYAAFALMGLALSACNKPGGEDPDVVEPEGELVTAKLAISIPKSIRTYAPGGGDPYATTDETTANRIDVFIYENGGSYATTHFEFTNNLGTSAPLSNPEDFRIEENGPGFADDVFETAEFQVREGDKLVYVGINLPALIRDRLATGYYVNEIYEDPDLLSQLITPNTTSGVNGSAVVPFFSSSRDANVKFDGIEDGGTVTTFPVTVNRLVSKVIVTTDGGSTSTAFDDVSGGTLTNFEFAIGQVNNQMFVAPLTGLLGANPANPGKDPNHDQVGVADRVGANTAQGVPVFQTIAVPGDYKLINDNTITDFTDLANYVHYATENTSALHRHQDVTYVSVRAQFIPHKLGGDPLTGDAGADYTAGTPVATLYAVFTGDGSGEGSDALGARYFDDLTDARAFVMGTYFVEQVLEETAGTVTDSGNGGVYVAGAAEFESDYYIFEYLDSWCYYRIYLNPDGVAENDGGGTTTGATNPYDVLRNTVYIARIDGVNYIGTTNPVAIPGGYEDGTLAQADIIADSERGTPIYPGDWFPNKLAGTPIYPETPIAAAADFATGLDVSLTVEDWYEHDDDYELN